MLAVQYLNIAIPQKLAWELRSTYTQGHAISSSSEIPETVLLRWDESYLITPVSITYAERFTCIR